MQPTADFDPKTAAKMLMRETLSGALGTLMTGSGDPYCSLVNTATAVDGTPLLLISRLALHTKNILADARVSLMLDERKEGDPLQGARVMLMGTAAQTDSPDARRRYLAHQPEAEMFAGFPDFAFYEIKLKGAHLVAGFGRIVDLKPSQLLTDLTDAEALVAAEPEVLEHMNADHADSLVLMARVLGGRADATEAVMTAVDRYGFDVVVGGPSGRAALRLGFDEAVPSAAAVRPAMVRLVERARNG